MSTILKVVSREPANELHGVSAYLVNNDIATLDDVERICDIAIDFGQTVIADEEGTIMQDETGTAFEFE